MFLPYQVDVPMYRLPIANWVLIGATVLISLVCLPKVPKSADSLPGPEGLTDQIQALQHPIKERPAPALALQPEHFSYWQLLTFVLVHGDVPHLLGNMFFLFCFGNAVNAKIGQLPYLGLYFGLGALDGLAWLGLSQDRPLYGAAGAIMGMVGAFVVFHPRNNVRTINLGMSGLTFRERSAYWVVLLGMVSDLVGTYTNPFGKLDYVCHLGVELLGMLAAAIFLELELAESAPHEENLLQLLGLREADTTPKKEEVVKPWPTAARKSGGKGRP